MSRSITHSTLASAFRRIKAEQAEAARVAEAKGWVDAFMDGLADAVVHGLDEAENRVCGLPATSDAIPRRHPSDRGRAPLAAHWDGGSTGRLGSVAWQAKGRDGLDGRREPYTPPQGAAKRVAGAGTPLNQLHPVDPRSPRVVGVVPSPRVKTAQTVETRRIVRPIKPKAAIHARSVLRARHNEAAAEKREHKRRTRMGAPWTMSEVDWLLETSSCAAVRWDAWCVARVVDLVWC